MPAGTFIGTPTKVFDDMSSDTENIKLRDILKVMVDNFLFMFLSASGVGFSLSALGVLSPQPDIYTFTLAFSTLWGFVGAAAAWSRKSDHIKIPRMFKNMMNVLGVDNKTQNILTTGANYIRKEFASRIFIPFVHSPSCH